MTRILLVEDDSTMRSLLETLLQLEGFETHSFGVIFEDDLLKNISTFQPDALLLDVHLQNTSGIEILQKIRQKTDMASIKIAMISGEDLAAECLSAGADKFLLKPFDTAEMIAWLHMVGK
jgi:DNA-binding response OmpR family regulator